MKTFEVVIVELDGKTYGKEIQAVGMGTNEGGDLYFFGEGDWPILIINRNSWQIVIDKASQEEEKASVN